MKQSNEALTSGQAASSTHGGEWRWRTYWIFLLVSYGLIGFFLVMAAIGYRYNPHQGRYQKTGMIIVNNPPKESTLEFDGQLYPLKPTNRIPNILPGVYRLAITRPGYQSWEETIKVAPGYVVSLNDIELFLTKADILPSPEQYAELLPFYTNQNDQRLRIIDGELRLGTQLISRFSQAPSKAVLSPSGRHVLYLQGEQLRVIDLGGQHDYMLYEGNALDPELLVIIEDVVVIREEGALRALKVN